MKKRTKRKSKLELEVEKLRNEASRFQTTQNYLNTEVDGLRRAMANLALILGCRNEDLVSEVRNLAAYRFNNEGRQTAEGRAAEDFKEIIKWQINPSSAMPNKVGGILGSACR